jgi:zinc transporter ZupT
VSRERYGWALLAIGALLFYLAWLGTVIAAYLFTVHTGEGIFRL